VKDRAAVLSAQIDQRNEISKRQIADAQSAAVWQAGVQNTQAKFALAAAQQKAQAKANPLPKGITDRTNFQIGALGQATNLLQEMKGSPAAKDYGVTTGLHSILPGERAGQDWDAKKKLLAFELGKISKQGTPTDDEVKSILETIPGRNASIAEKKAWAKQTDQYLHGQKQGVNYVFDRAGRTIPYPTHGIGNQENVAGSFLPGGSGEE
jgi:hypothetical protein